MTYTRASVVRAVVGVGLVASLFNVGCWMVLRYQPETPQFPTIYNSIALLGSPTSAPATTATIYTDQNPRADLSVLSDIANVVSIPLHREKDAFLLNNPIGIPAKDFSIYLHPDEDTILVSDYDKAKHKLTFSLPSISFAIGGQKYTTDKTPLVEMDRIQGDVRLMRNDDMSDPIGQPSGNKFYVTLKELSEEDVFIVKQISGNILDRNISSFETGLWVPKVADCSIKASGVADIAMAINSDATDGRQSLLLSSKNHIACTNRNFRLNTKADEMYVLSFDYKNVGSQWAQYYFKLWGNSGIYEHSERLPLAKNVWKSYETTITPQDFENIDIYFYAPDDGNTISTILYDNVRIGSYTKERLNISSLSMSDVLIRTGITLAAGQTALVPDVGADNLIGQDNYSFENGLWTSHVADCNNKESGEPLISMSGSSDASDGVQSLQLTSRNHPACTDKLFPVNLSRNFVYTLAFDYKIMSGTTGQWYYKLYGTGENHAVSSNFSAEKRNRWQTEVIDINQESNLVHGIDLYLYAPSMGDLVSIVYDNVRLRVIAQKNIGSIYFYRKQQVADSSKVRAVEWKPVDSWKSRVILHGVKSPFILAYPAQYSKKWKAYPVPLEEDMKNISISDDHVVSDIESDREASKNEINGFLASRLISATGDKFISKNFDGSIRNDNLNNGWFGESWFKDSIPEDVHYQVNNYGNSWWIDPAEICIKPGVCQKNDDGSYDISLIVEHSAFKYLSLMLLISGTTLFGCIGYLVFASAQRRKGKKLVKSKKRQQMFSHRRVRREEADIKNK